MERPRVSARLGAKRKAMDAGSASDEVSSMHTASKKRGRSGQPGSALHQQRGRAGPGAAMRAMNGHSHAAGRGRPVSTPNAHVMYSPTDPASSGRADDLPLAAFAAMAAQRAGGPAVAGAAPSHPPMPRHPTSRYPAASPPQYASAAGLPVGSPAPAPPVPGRAVVYVPPVPKQAAASAALLPNQAVAYARSPPNRAAAHTAPAPPPPAPAAAPSAAVVPAAAGSAAAGAAKGQAQRQKQRPAPAQAGAVTPASALRSEAAYILTREGLDAAEAARALDATAARYVSAVAAGGGAADAGADATSSESNAAADDAAGMALE